MDFLSFIGTLNRSADSPPQICVYIQGGALTLHLKLRSSFPSVGCVAFGTWLPFHAGYPAALSKPARSMPIFQVHYLFLIENMFDPEIEAAILSYDQ